GTILYLFIFIVFRLLRRNAGGLNIMDVLLIVLVADAAQNGMADDYKSITEGMILVATIAFWNFFLDWLAFKLPAIRPLLDPEPFPLIENGKMNRKNMDQEMITEESLLGQLRQQGVDDVKLVKSCHLESDGRISVVKFEEEIKQKPKEVIK
ncbi:MAG: DUF421 domain-containing protein, partial [Saprospiraceae bacterium]